MNSHLSTPLEQTQLSLSCLDRHQVKSEVQRCNPLEIKTAARQGDEMSPILFNIVREKDIKDATDNLTQLANWLAPADSLATLAETPTYLKNSETSTRTSNNKV